MGENDARRRVDGRRSVGGPVVEAEAARDSGAHLGRGGGGDAEAKGEGAQVIFRQFQHFGVARRGARRRLGHEFVVVVVGVHSHVVDVRCWFVSTQHCRIDVSCGANTTEKQKLTFVSTSSDASNITVQHQSLGNCSYTTDCVSGIARPYVIDDVPMPDDVELLTVSTSVKPDAGNYPPQDWLESVLRRHLRSLPTVRCQLGAQLVTLDNGPDHVQVTVRDAAGRERTVRAAYLVAADGAHSSIRHMLGVPRADHGGKAGGSGKPR